MEPLDLIRKELRELDTRISAIEFALREAAEADKPLIVSAADIGLNQLVDVKNSFLKSASSFLSKASDAIKPSNNGDA